MVPLIHRFAKLKIKVISYMLPILSILFHVETVNSDMWAGLVAALKIDSLPTKVQLDVRKIRVGWHNMSLWRVIALHLMKSVLSVLGENLFTRSFLEMVQILNE